MEPIAMGFDMDGVISLLPFGCKQVMLTPGKEQIFWQFQRSKFLQRFYNCCVRKPNPEIRSLMSWLRDRGFKVIIISASNESYRQELERWLKKHDFVYDGLYLKESGEDCLSFKARVVPLFCRCYLDDKEEIIGAINRGIDNNGRCRAFLYHGQTKEEIFSSVPLFKVFKTA